MINAEEHKKLLAQIAELEKNSVNYFDVEKEFFLIDSDNLTEVKTRLYGYSIQATGIYEQDNLTEDAAANLDGRGCYVYVEARDGHITIKQDLNGCWGLHLFRHGDYFALSNSFFRLLDHVKFKYPLTVNRDYCHYLLINDVSSHAYSETAVNEIRLLERNSVLHIDTVKKKLEIELIDYREHTISLDSEKGITILDNWVKFWSDIFCNVAQRTKFFQTALSGGFDTRVSLILLLNSGVDINNMRVISKQGTVHTFEEDYAIASQIATHYGFKLNRSLPAQKTLLYSLNDISNYNLYSTQTFTKLSDFSARKNINKIYSIDGAGGETIRGNWLRFGSLERFIQIQKGRTKHYSSALSDKLSDSVKNILESTFSVIRNKYKIEDPNSLWLAQYFYHETRCRHHFGKNNVRNKLATNVVRLSPVFDPQIRTLRFNTTECPDHQLLIALLFIRYEPDLLKFPFQGKRSIAPETIAYAKKINARFPRPLVTNNENGGVSFNLQTRDLQAEKLLMEGKKNPDIPNGLGNACLKAMFESSRTHGLFTAYFDEELYRYAANYYETHIFQRNTLMYSVVGVTRALEDVEVSQRNHPLYQDVKRFLELDFCKIHEDTTAQILDKFSRYFTARVDFKFLPKTGQADFQIASVSDKKADLVKASWLKKGDSGYVLQSHNGNLEVVTKATADGQIILNLRGVDIRTPEDKSKRIPYWVDYTKLIVNGKVIFDKLTPAWHDKIYGYNISVKAGEEIKVQVEWLPHRSDV